MTPKRTFASDNFSSVDLLVMSYLSEINGNGHTQSYEGDAVTREAESLFVETFGEGTEVIFVPTGTGANILSLKLLLQQPYEAVVTSQVSHVFEEETGALAANTGAHIFTLPHRNGKIDLDTLRQDVLMRQELGFHSALPKVVSIANSTEFGTYYTPDEVKAIADFCHGQGMYLHMDGCRLPNVAAALGVSLKEITRDAGVNVLSFGGAKNGLMSAESVVIFNAPDSDHLRMQKQSMQLVSKLRYVSGQFVPYLRDEHWRENALHANALAKQLGEKLESMDGVRLTQPVATNQVFCILPEAAKAAARKAGHMFYDWTSPGEVRFVTSWDNTTEDVEELFRLLEGDS
jgi:threonine aldolase